MLPSVERWWREYEFTNHDTTAPLNGKCLTSDATKRNDMKWHVFVAVLEKKLFKRINLDSLNAFF